MNDKEIITKDIQDITNGVQQMIERYIFLRDKLNRTSAYTEEETQERLKNIQERKTIEHILYSMNIQAFEIKYDFYKINII